MERKFKAAENGNTFHCESRKCTGAINVTGNTCAFNTERSLYLNAVLQHDHQKAPLPFTGLTLPVDRCSALCVQRCVSLSLSLLNLPVHLK